ncbi:TPA: hypothetical protein ACH3X2_012488 [Trebouxia sp. C0005]
MQAPMARIFCTPCVFATANSMPQGAACLRLYHSLCSLTLEGPRPAQAALPSLLESFPFAQSASCFPVWAQPAANSDQANSNSQLSGFLALPYTPLMPVQVQAALRAHEVQQLTSIASNGTEQLDPTIANNAEDMLCATKRTYQPSVIIRKRRHGFLNRISSRGGRNVMRRRKAKGRYNITA